MNYKTLKLPKISPDEELRPRTRDLFRALALPMAAEKDLCEALCALLKKEGSVREVLSVFGCAVLDPLYEAIHAYPEHNKCTVEYITTGVNAILRQRGEPGKLTDKRVGNLLTSLNLTLWTRTNVGLVLWLTHETREQIHSLVRAYRVKARPIPEGSAPCDLCKFVARIP